MDGNPVYATRNQSSHFRRTRFRVLRPNYQTRKIPAQERHMVHPSLCVVPEEPQTFATAVRNQRFGFDIIARPLRGTCMYAFCDASPPFRLLPATPSIPHRRRDPSKSCRYRFGYLLSHITVFELGFHGKIEPVDGSTPGHARNRMPRTETTNWRPPPSQFLTLPIRLSVFPSYL